MRMSNAELRRIQHHEHFGRESLGGRLASFAQIRLANRIPLLVQALLKTPQPGDAIAHRSRLPLRLRRPWHADGSVPSPALADASSARHALPVAGFVSRSRHWLRFCFACHIQYSKLTR